MKYRVLENIKLKTSKSEIELRPEQVTALPDKVATLLLGEGRIAPVGKTSYRIYSKTLEDYLWVVTTDKARNELIAEGVKDAIYTQEEVSNLIDEGISEEGLKAVHKVKSTFIESSVIDIDIKS